MYRFLIVSTSLFFTFASSNAIGACQLHDGFFRDTFKVVNNIPPRLQWGANFGYCGEESLISAGLYYGQYISQYDVRKIASKNGSQNMNSSQLLLGENDLYAASQLHLDAVGWDIDQENNTDQFLAWVKQNTIRGYPVTIGVFMNEYLFYNINDPDAGEDEYDHIIIVTGVESNHSLDSSFYEDDVIQFNDHGLWGIEDNPSYIFKYYFGKFQANRQEANAKNGPVYSLSNSGRNYGLAVKGVVDLDGDTLPVRLVTNHKYEKPAIKDGSDSRPTSMPIVLTITVSDLQPGVAYNFYKYNKMELVPDSQFNAYASNACEVRQIQIDSGSTYILTEEINSDEIAVYRVVQSTAA